MAFIRLGASQGLAAGLAFGAIEREVMVPDVRPIGFPSAGDLEILVQHFLPVERHDAFELGVVEHGHVFLAAPAPLDFHLWHLTALLAEMIGDLFSIMALGHRLAEPSFGSPTPEMQCRSSI